jgi:sugar/nucleoside kinase (ribokinase family)
LKQACRLGNAFGAIVAQQEGATQHISYQEVVTFMQAGRPGIVDKKLAYYLK